jgi:hypothetical protein
VSGSHLSFFSISIFSFIPVQRTHRYRPAPAREPPTGVKPAAATQSSHMRSPAAAGKNRPRARPRRPGRALARARPRRGGGRHLRVLHDFSFWPQADASILRPCPTLAIGEGAQTPGSLLHDWRRHTRVLPSRRRPAPLGFSLRACIAAA